VAGEMEISSPHAGDFTSRRISYRFRDYYTRHPPRQVIQIEREREREKGRSYS